MNFGSPEFWKTPNSVNRSIIILGKHGRKVKKQDIPIFCSEEEEEDQDEQEMEIEASQQQSDDEKNKKKELAKRRFSVKRLIRLLHISAPVYHVMAILGKK